MPPPFYLPIPKNPVSALHNRVHCAAMKKSHLSFYCARILGCAVYGFERFCTEDHVRIFSAVFQRSLDRKFSCLSIKSSAHGYFMLIAFLLTHVSYTYLRAVKPLLQTLSYECLVLDSCIGNVCKLYVSFLQSSAQLPCFFISSAFKVFKF